MKRAIAFAAAAILATAMPAMARHKKQEPPAPQVPPPVAQSGPSFEATRDWIDDTLSQYGGYWEDSAGIWKVYSNVTISNSCVLTFKITQFQSDYKSGSKPFLSVLMTIPLETVTNSTLDEYRGAPFLTIYTGNLSAVTVTDGWGASGPPPDNAYSSYQLDIARMPRAVAGQPEPDSPQDIAKRFLPAFQHMVDICKSTYQAPPAQPNEPF